jgi:GntR family transcriptional regulator
MPRLSSRDIAAILRQQIIDRKWPRGSMLPSEPELALTYDTTRSTINRAIQDLRRDGLVSPRQGRGTTVTFMPPITRDSTARYNKELREQSRGAFAAEIERLGMTPRSQTTVLRELPPPEVAEVLGTPEGEEVVVRHRVMFADDTVVQVAPTYIPLDIAGGTQLEQIEQPAGGMVSTLEQLGFKEVEIEETITLSRAPTEDEQDTLKIGADQAVFEMMHVAFDQSGRAVEATRHVGPAHFWRFKYRFPIT